METITSEERAVLDGLARVTYRARLAGLLEAVDRLAHALDAASSARDAAALPADALDEDERCVFQAVQARLACVAATHPAIGAMLRHLPTVE